MYRDTFQLNAPIIMKETIDFHRGGMLQQWAEKNTSFPTVNEAQDMQMACCEHGLKRTQGCSGVGTAFPHPVLVWERVPTPFCTRNVT